MPFATWEQVRADVQRVARGLGQPEPLVSYDSVKMEYVVGPLEYTWGDARRFVDQLPQYTVGMTQHGDANGIVLHLVSDYRVITLTGWLAGRPSFAEEGEKGQPDRHGTAAKRIEEWKNVAAARRDFAIEARNDSTDDHAKAYWQGRIDAFTDVVGEYDAFFSHYLD